MQIIIFFVLFVFVGYILKIVFKDDIGKSFMVILLITIIWLVLFGPWAIATFFELILGYLMFSRDNTVKRTKEYSSEVSKIAYMGVENTFDTDFDKKKYLSEGYGFNGFDKNGCNRKGHRFWQMMIMDKLDKNYMNELIDLEMQAIERNLKPSIDS